MANSVALGAESRVGAPADWRYAGRRGLLLAASVRLRRPWLDGKIAQGLERRGDRGFALRRAQLAGPRERRRLARCFERLLTEQSRPAAPGSAAPVDRAAVEAVKSELTEFVLTLLSEEAVEPRGVILGWRLLTDPCSPLYASQGRAVDIDRLRREVLAVLFALRPLIDPPAAPAANDKRTQTRVHLAGSRAHQWQD